MKTGYIVILIVLMLFIVLCMLYVNRKVKKYEKTLLKLLASAVVSTIAYIFFLRSSDLSTAIFWDAVYFWMCDILSFLMMEFIMQYTEITYKSSIWKRILCAIIGVDGIALLLNNKMNWMFSLEEKTVKIHNMTVSYYTEVFEVQHYFHLGLCYVMVAYTMGILIYKIGKSSILHKRRYRTIFFPFTGLIILNAFCYSQSFPIDASVALYGILSCSICYCVGFVIPHSVLSQAQMYVMDSIVQGIIFLDEQGTCIYANKVMQDWKKEKGAEYFQSVEKYLYQVSLRKRNEIRISDRWNEAVVVEKQKHSIDMQYHAMCDKNQDYLGSYFILEDKTEETRKHEEERYRANHDLLTGLYNRTRFFERVDEEIQKNPDGKRYLLVSNVKDFKLINNIYGKDYGDELIRKQADLIKQCMEEDTFCGRIYGDKFAMVVCRDSYRSEIFQNAVKALQQFTMQKKYKIFYHIGVYDISGKREPAEKLYNRVNMIMSTVSNDYDRVFVECNEDEIVKIVKRREMITELEEAIQSKQFVMYLQPQVDSQGKAKGAEALIRWNHPQKGLLYPGDFIEVFESAGLIYQLDLYIWHLAGQKLAEWKKQGLENAYISVNISTKDFYYLDIYEEMVRIVSDYQIQPDQLKLEITESALIYDKKNEFSTISRLREFGFEVEIDDFGSGYSSFNMLKDIGVDVLKIDRIFLNETQNHEKSKMILHAIVALAKEMKIGIVTEGVEKQSQVDMLTELGCNIFQGYYFDKPLPIEQFEEKYLNMI